jgi:tRNA pseudouridine38-40 synthase
MNLPRLALKFAYDGARFHGSQRQTKQDVRTVEGDLLRALERTIALDEPGIAEFRVASRTDRGVSALGNVFTIATTFSENELIAGLNAHLTDCWVYGIAKVTPDFNPRWARERWYRYYLSGEELDPDMISQGTKIFIGKHNFRNFANREVENPVRTIKSIEVQVQKSYYILDFRAENFIWNQIRRIIKAIELVAIRKKQLYDVKYALEHPEEDIDFGVAAAENLVLMDILYNFEFDIDDGLFSEIQKKLQTQMLLYI